VFKQGLKTLGLWIGVGLLTLCLSVGVFAVIDAVITVLAILYGGGHYSGD
jgi:hypothetical protein